MQQLPNYYTSRRQVYPTQTRKSRKKRVLLFFVIIVLIISGIVTLIIQTRSIATAKRSVTVINDTNQSTTSSGQTTVNSAAPVESAQQTALKTAWANVANTREGDVDIAVYNSKTKETTHYTNAASTLNTASIIKLAIAEKTFIQAQQNDTTVTATQAANLAAMLEQSDNAAATTLWNEAGGKTSMDAFFKSISATDTVAGDNGHWGLTQTTALDQLKILNVLAYSKTLLTADSANSINTLLDDVDADQIWGVSAGLTGQADFKLKNGWLEDDETNDEYNQTASWTVNSIGHITADGVDYTIAVLTQGQTTETYGIETIEAISQETWSVLTGVSSN